MLRKPVRIFLSHASADRRFVERLAGILDSRKLSYWYSQRHVVGAQEWHNEIGKALGRCNWLVLVLTPAATKSKWVKHELLFAPRGYDRRDQHARVVRVTPAP